MNFYYLGLKRNTINNNNFFKNAVVLRDCKSGDISYQNIFNQDIDYNDVSKFAKISEFYDYCISKIEKEDVDCKFMLYNQAAIEFINNTKNIVCCNNIKLIKVLNNKPECRELLKDVINVLDYKYLNARDADFDCINKLFDYKFKKYVVQQPVGFAGIGTFLLDSNTSLADKLNKEITYSVSGYIEGGKSVNNTFMISDNYIHIFDGSFQLILANKELEYDGWDFEAYDKLNKNLKSKIYNQTFKIAKKLQVLGYRGIGGVDYLLKDENIYFMEINPRFQASSQELDKMLIKRGYLSIFELNYLAFYDEKKFVKICKNI